jgi:hypothetical protein
MICRDSGCLSGQTMTDHETGRSWSQRTRGWGRTSDPKSLTSHRQRPQADCRMGHRPGGPYRSAPPGLSFAGLPWLAPGAPAWPPARKQSAALAVRLPVVPAPVSGPSFPAGSDLPYQRRPDHRHRGPLRWAGLARAGRPRTRAPASRAAGKRLRPARRPAARAVPDPRGDPRARSRAGAVLYQDHPSAARGPGVTSRRSGPGDARPGGRPGTAHARRSRRLRRRRACTHWWGR